MHDDARAAVPAVGAEPLLGSDDTPTITADGCETVASPEAADVVIAFVRTRADLDTVASPAVSAACADKLA